MYPWILAARSKTLPAAFVPVTVGAFLANYHGYRDWITFALCALFAVLLQIGANYANDYYDFQKGADTRERIGPTRAVAAGLVSPEAMWRATVITFTASFLVGIAIILRAEVAVSWLILVILCILSGIAYTGGPFPLAYNGWGEFFVLVFFGVVAVSGTFIAIVVAASTLEVVELTSPVINAVWLGLGIGSLSSNLLVLNNYRDYSTDKEAGKKTLIVRIGQIFGVFEYTLFDLVAATVPLLLYFRNVSATILLGSLILPPALLIVIKMTRAVERKQFDRLLAATAGILLLYGILLCYGFSLAA